MYICFLESGESHAWILAHTRLLLIGVCRDQQSWKGGGGRRSQLALGNQRAHLLSTVLWCIRLWTTKGARSNYPITYYVTSDSAFND
jgi:hypothetical protein